MKRFLLTILSVALCVMLIIFSGCDALLGGIQLPSLGGGKPQGGTPHQSAAGIPDRLTAEEEKIVRFSDGAPINMQVSNGYANAAPFDCLWSSSCVQLQGDRLLMSVTEGVNYSRGREYKYMGAECRTWSSDYSYGFYSVSMKAAKCSGVISSFFTYTNRGGWDEIDIEFLGKDTTGIQLNYYTNGVGGHEFWYELGFDGADDFHEYAFLWLADSITWYVDGKAVYRATDSIPTRPTQIMMNVWNCSGADDWSGKFNPNALPATAQYQWIGYSAAEAA